ncbi:MAG: hypothetical protein ACN4GR_14450 [Arenicellales bacterium]
MKIVLLVIAVLLASTAQAETDAPWWQIWHSADEATNTPGRLFTKDEKRIIQSYFEDHREYRYDNDNDESGRDKPKKQKSLPPGLQKKLARGGQLPPGWQKKVARGEVLDMTLYRQSRPLPEGLLNRLSSGPADTELRLLDDRVMRLMDDSRDILDVLQVY